MSIRWSDYVNTGGFPVYSESFKRKVVAKVESGHLSKEEARRKYNIGFCKDAKHFGLTKYRYRS